MKRKSEKRKGGGLLDKMIPKGMLLSEAHREIGEAMEEIIRSRSRDAVLEVVTARHEGLSEELNGEMSLLIYCRDNALPYPPEAEDREVIEQEINGGPSEPVEPSDESGGLPTDLGEPETSEMPGQADDGESSPSTGAPGEIDLPSP